MDGHCKDDIGGMLWTVAQHSETCGVVAETAGGSAGGKQRGAVNGKADSQGEPG